MKTYVALRTGLSLTMIGLTAALVLRGGWQAASAAVAVLGGLLLIVSYAVLVAATELAATPRPPQVRTQARSARRGQTAPSRGSGTPERVRPHLKVA